MPEAFRKRSMYLRRARATTPERRLQLQDEWLPLAYCVAHESPGYQVALLERFAQGVVACPTLRQRRYLLRAATDHPQRFVGLAAVAGVAWPSGLALLLHSLEELEDCTAAECQELHLALAYEDPPTPAPLPWLLERLGAWLVSRHPTPAADRSVA